MLHDTHAHLDLLAQRLGLFPGIDKNDFERSSLDRISDLEMDKTKIHDLVNQHDFLIQPTVSTNNFWLAYHLFHSFENIFFLVGSHPEIVTPYFDIHKYIDDQREIIIELESSTEMSEKVVGIGEVGLDYYYSQDKDIIQNQISLFEDQILLAIKLKLPLVIHCREAFKDLFEVLKEYPAIHGHFLVHCYTEGKEYLQQILDLGGKIGVGGVVTFNSAKPLQEAVKYCPYDSFVLETDLPFLAPSPYRGKVCTPDMVSIIAEFVAGLKGVDTETVWEYSRDNSKKIFEVYSFE